jgi:hypothetical protein
MKYNPQPGMWAATGTAIAYASTLGELGHPVNGSKNIVYSAHGHGARSTSSANPDCPAVTTTEVKARTVLERTDNIIESPTLVNAAPAMDHSNEDSNDSLRKEWIEIDSQILNTLFCVTGFGLAPWRFRDLYWMIQARLRHNQHAMMHLYKQNESWFRPPRWYHGVDLESG